MAKVYWTKTALKDLQIIVNYIAMDSPFYAEKLGRKLSKAPRLLNKHPKIGRKVPEFNLESIRELIYGSYRIIYEVRDDICYIVAIIHSSRDIMEHYLPGAWEIT